MQRISQHGFPCVQRHPSPLWPEPAVLRRQTRSSRKCPARVHFRNSHSCVWVQCCHHGPGAGPWWMWANVGGSYGGGGTAGCHWCCPGLGGGDDVRVRGAGFGRCGHEARGASAVACSAMKRWRRCPPSAKVITRSDPCAELSTGPPTDVSQADGVSRVTPAGGEFPGDPPPPTPAGLRSSALILTLRRGTHSHFASRPDWRQVVGLLHYPGPPARSLHDAAGQIRDRPDQRLAAWASVSQRRRPLLRRLSVPCRLLSIAASSCRSRQPEAWITA